MADASSDAPVACLALGCRVSQADVEAIAGGLAPGFRPAAEGEPADYVVVGTCTITADADAASRRAIRRAAREHPRAPIVVTGCYAEVAPRELSGLPNVVAVLGTRAQAAAPELLHRIRGGEDPGAALAHALAGAPAWARPPGVRLDHTRVLLKVQDGCDSGCSYCVVPRARGPARSLPFDEALLRLGALGQSHAEVVLSGVRLGLYGRDLSPRRSLEDLVRAAAARKLARRLRLSSIEPSEFPDGLTRSGEAGRILCGHFHVPLQSGSDRMLAVMGRPYRAGEFAALLERIASALPGACIGTDVMVGHPGETDADHRETLRLVAGLPLAYLHVFPWSSRAGTRAARMEERVDGAVARERSQELLALSQRRWRAWLGTQSGRDLEVVVERVEGGIARGTSRRYVPVRWPASREQRGALTRVRVESNDGKECFGVRSSAFRERIPP